MVARFWSAHTTPAHAPAYAEHLKNHVLPTVNTVDGYTGTMLLEREVSDGVELVVITFWHSLEALRGVAGADLEHAVVAEEAVSLLTEFDRRVRHDEVMLKDEAGAH